MLIAIGPESADSNFFVNILRANVGRVPIFIIDQNVSVLIGLPLFHCVVVHEVQCLPHANLVAIKCGIDLSESLACDIIAVANIIFLLRPVRTKGRMNAEFSTHKMCECIRRLVWDELKGVRDEAGLQVNGLANVSVGPSRLSQTVHDNTAALRIGQYRHLFARFVELLHLLHHRRNVVLGNVVVIEVPVLGVVYWTSRVSILAGELIMSCRVDGAPIVSEPHVELPVEKLLGESTPCWVELVEPNLGVAPEAVLQEELSLRSLALLSLAVCIASDLKHDKVVAVLSCDLMRAPGVVSSMICHLLSKLRVVGAVAWDSAAGIGHVLGGK